MVMPKTWGRPLTVVAAACALVALAGCGATAHRADPAHPVATAPPSTTHLTVVPPEPRQTVPRSTTTTTTPRPRATYPSFESCRILQGRPVTYDALDAAWLANTVEPKAPDLERLLCAAANATSSQALAGPQAKAVRTARRLYDRRVITRWERNDIVNLVRDWNANRSRRPSCAIPNADGTTSACRPES